MSRRRTLSVLSVLMLAGGIVACSAPPAPDAGVPAPSASAILSVDDLDGLTPAEMIDTLQAVPVAERAADFSASVRPASLLLTNADGTETDLALPQGRFHLSVAPYVDTTHDCYFHNLTTCRGELAGREFQVSVVGADGATVFDDTLVAADNGFVGFWLPSGIEGTLTVRDGDRTGTAQIATGADDPTCLTSLQLA